MSFDQISSPPAQNSEVIVNENFATLAPFACYGKKASTTTGLTWGYYGGRFGNFVIDDGMLSLTASSTNHVVVEVATGAISVSIASTNWDDTTNYRRVYKITTGATAVSGSPEDHRLATGGVWASGAIGSITAADVSDFTEAAQDIVGAMIVSAGGSYDDGAGTISLPAGSSTTGKHAIYIAAGSMSPSVTGGCAALAGVATSANQPDVRTLDFDTTTQEFAQFGIVMPKSWDEGTITFRAHWSHASTTTNFGVAWELQAVAVSDDDAIAAAYGTAQTVTDTGGTTNDLYTTAESSAITVAGAPAAEDMVFFRVARAPANGSDTLAIDARLHGITVYITTSAETDA